MRKNSCCRKILGDQRGMALVSALLLLLIVTMLALGMSTDTSIDVRIAAYQRFKARAFGFAEAGLVGAGDILEDNIDDAGWPGVLPFTYPGLSNSYFDASDPPVGGVLGSGITVLNDGAFYMRRNPAENVMLRMVGDIQADIVTQKVVAKLAEGGAIQVAAGYAGMGKGVASGGGHIIYNLTSNGVDSDQVRSRVAMHYRHLTK